MTDKIIGNELFWLAAMAPPLLFFLCLLGNRAWQTLKSIHHRLANRKPSRLANRKPSRLANRKPSRLALALGSTIPLAFAAFIALQLLWAATDDNRVARCEREHQARLAKCKETKKDAHDSADMEFELAKDKCANKREEDLAQCESAYNEAVENCASTRDDKKRKADNQLKADLLKCNGDPDCIRNAILARALAHANADSEYDKCVENANSAKGTCDANAEAAHTRCVKDAEDERDIKKARADYGYKKCKKRSKRMLEACLNPDDGSGDSSGDGSY